jgi:hypothetical protein
MASSSSASCSGSESEEDEQVEVGSYSVPYSALSKALTTMKEEELVVKSSKGPQILVLVDALLARISTSSESVSFVESISGQLQSCLSPNKRGQVVLSKLWRKFHLLRLATSTRKMWQSCIKALHLPDDVMAISDTCLQLVLKRMMQNIIHQLTDSQACSPVEVEISLDDCNGIRYIAGYVVLKMKKKFPQTQAFLTS